MGIQEKRRFSVQPQSPDEELEKAYEAFALQKTVSSVDPYDIPHFIFIRHQDHVEWWSSTGGSKAFSSPLLGKTDLSLEFQASTLIRNLIKGAGGGFSSPLRQKLTGRVFQGRTERVRASSTRRGDDRVRVCRSSQRSPPLREWTSQQTEGRGVSLTGFGYRKPE